MLLRHVLYHHTKLADGYSLISEVHQESELDSVDIVVPDIPEEKAVVALINKQLPVYLSSHLVEADIVKVFVKAFNEGAICPSLNHADGAYTWDSSKKIVTTPEDAEREQ